MTQHTPGPWAYTPKDNRGWHSIRSSDHRTVAEIICQLPTESESNAHLIAAAPEMLVLIQDFGQWLEAALTKGQINRGTANRDSDFVSQIRGLLAKIEGR